MRKYLDMLIVIGIIFIVTVLVTMFDGCCSVPKEVVRIDTVKVTVPGDVFFDTVRIVDGKGESIKYIVLTDTVKQNVYIKGKDRIVTVAVHDTVVQYVKDDSEPGFFDGVTLKDIGMVLLGVTGLAFLTSIIGLFRPR